MTPSRVARVYRNKCRILEYTWYSRRNTCCPTRSGLQHWVTSFHSPLCSAVAVPCRPLPLWGSTCGIATCFVSHVLLYIAAMWHTHQGLSNSAHCAICVNYAGYVNCAMCVNLAMYGTRGICITCVICVKYAICANGAIYVICAIYVNFAMCVACAVCVARAMCVKGTICVIYAICAFLGELLDVSRLRSSSRKGRRLSM